MGAGQGRSPARSGSSPSIDEFPQSSRTEDFVLRKFVSSFDLLLGLVCCIHQLHPPWKVVNGWTAYSIRTIEVCTRVCRVDCIR